MRTKILFHQLGVGEKFYRQEYDELQCTKTGLSVYTNANGIYIEMLYRDSPVYIEVE